MFYALAAVVICLQSIQAASGNSCENKCRSAGFDMTCGFVVKRNQYKMFPSKCALEAYRECNQVELKETPLKYCIKAHTNSRRMYGGESCPVFCPSYYRPVCGAAKLRFYKYKTFTNGCYLDMVNCRGDDEFSEYVEVPLEFCQRHLMKNIFKDQVVITNLQDFHDYN